MRVLVTGAGGQLGRSLVAEGERRGLAVIALDRTALDVTDRGGVAAAVAEHRPAWVFHCAAATKVDRCESERGWAERLNAEAPGFVAAACAASGAKLVHYSTDFVFDGTKNEPYLEDDPVRPLSVYGSTKAAGEAAVRGSRLDRWLILRSQWVYGPGGRCFPAAILAKARAGENLRVVDDQRGSPTMTEDLARASLDLARLCDAGRADYGLYHAAGSGVVSWYEFALLILEHAGIRGVKIEAIGSDALDLPASRPAYSVLDTRRLTAALGRPLPDIEDALIRYLAAEGQLDDAARRT